MASNAAEFAVATESRFFQVLLEHLTTVLDADGITVVQFPRNHSGKAVKVAACPATPGSEAPGFDLAGTPEGELLRSAKFLHYQNVTDRFPGDARLARSHAHTWSGVRLEDSSGVVLGALSVVFRHARTSVGTIEATLSRYAPDAAAELEREQREEALRLTESRFEDLVQYTREGFWCIEFASPTDLDLPEDEIVARTWEATFAVANDAVARMVGCESASQVVGQPLWRFKDNLRNIESQFRQQARSKFGQRTFEFQVFGNDGAESWFERSVVPIFAGGKLLRVWGTTRDISERKRHEQEVCALNANLERIVADRTAQLEAANHELQSFSYSISHDLRAAIQGIVACSRIVIEEHGHQLDDAGRLWLTHMAGDAAQLDKLTLALLELSTVARAVMSRGQVDLSSIAESIAQGLMAGAPERKAEFHIAPGMMVTADPVLLRRVMENLLGNAWKFTRTRALAEIEVGVQEAQTDEPVYFVRDNGVGFSMKYAEKLFGAFQRLHRVEDFEGSGIGLAAVRRAIHRHGGRAWAQAELDRGATIFFTLGKSGIP